MVANSKRWVDDLVLCLYLPVVIVAGASISIPLWDWANAAGGDIAHELTRKGPARFTRRITMVLAFLLLPLALRALRWEGWRDSGWQHAAGISAARRDGLTGLIHGLIIMTILFATALIIGTRIWHISVTGGELALSTFTFLIGALVVGILEETIARGILFRLLIQRWRPISVIVIVSIVFAWLHFLAAEPTAYEAGPYLQRVSNVLVSSSTGFLRIPHAMVEMTNLALFSALLSLMYLKSGSIWLAAGFHAGVVYIKRLNGIVADSVKDHEQALFLGVSSDFTDGWFCAILLSLLIIWFIRKQKALSIHAA